MEVYGKILLIAMPIFLLLVLFEKWYGCKKGNDTVNTMDMVSSLTSGVTNVTKDVLGLSIFILGYEWYLQYFKIIEIKATWLIYLVAFIALDFTGYWVHRIDHKINFFWNSHIVHHSSEEFNLACALRQSISSFVKIFSFFLLPAALLGVPSVVIATVAPLHLFAQFWYHTQHINKMGFLEHIIVTPSHHRVHHAFNKEYLDKNFGQIFIIWDKWFGTYQAELPNVPAVYGITRPVQTWNPIKINFQHLWLLIQDAWRTNTIKDKLRIWFMPTGWRPKDVEENYPVYKIADAYNFEKYKTNNNRSFAIWLWVQLITLLLFVSYFFANIATIKALDVRYIYFYGAFVFIYVYAFTELMDGNKYAVFWEGLKCILGIAFIIYSGDWFGSDAFSILIKYGVIAYFLGSLIITFLLAKQRSTVVAP
jgi:sterol desaturase/sphingolipid hydroxylase (fatty acid hydroxylase superfamily)